MINILKTTKVKLKEVIDVFENIAKDKQTRKGNFKSIFAYLLTVTEV